MRVLNVIVDILTLVCVAAAGVGHLLPWFAREAGDPHELIEFQTWHAMRSGIALGALAVFLILSLAIHWGPGMRRFLVLCMFLSAFTAIVFEALVFSWFPFTPAHEQLVGQIRTDSGFLLAIVPTCVAAGLSLIRMIWTMPAGSSKNGVK